jgi:hypothetical protein
VNILNKQLHTAKNRLSSSTVLGWGVTITHHEKLECYNKNYRGLEVNGGSESCPMAGFGI